MASAPLLPDAAAASAGSAGGSLGELRSFAGASFSRQLGARELRQLTQWYDKESTNTTCSIFGCLCNCICCFGILISKGVIQWAEMAATIWRTRSAPGGGVARIINTQHCDQPQNDTLLKHNAHSLVFQASERVLHTCKSVNTRPTFSTLHGTKSPSGLRPDHPALIVFYA